MVIWVLDLSAVKVETCSDDGYKGSYNNRKNRINFMLCFISYIFTITRILTFNLLTSLPIQVTQSRDLNAVKHFL